jgi:hypothetical protein
MKYIKMRGNARGTRIRRSPVPTGGPRRPGQLGPSQGQPLSLTAVGAQPRRGPHASVRAQRDAAATRRSSQRGTRPGRRAGKGRRAYGGLGVTGRLTRGTNTRDSAASGRQRPALRGTCRRGGRPVRAQIGRGGRGGAVHARN